MTTIRQPLRARYVGYTKGTENHGDEALIWIIRELLAPEIEITCTDDGYDLALLGGGTLINQSPWLIDEFRRHLDRAGRGLVFGTGVGHPTFWGNNFAEWSKLLGRCPLVGVRGPISTSLLHEHGVAGARFIGDPYLALSPPFERDPAPGLLGVNAGSTNNSQWGGNEKDFLAFLEKTLLELRACGWRFLWLSVWSRDLPVVEELRQRVDGGEGPLLDARTDTLEVLCRLAACELFVGEKLHANAMAAVAGVPFLSLEYQPKVRDLAASLGMEEWVLTTALRDPSAICGKLEAMRESGEELRAHLRGQLRERRRALFEFANEIKRVYTPVRASAT